MNWSDPYQVKPSGRGNYSPLDVKTAGGEGVPADRFHLFQTRDQAKRLPTMWVLLDKGTGNRHFLYGHGWDGAQAAAATLIPSLGDAT